MSNAWTSFYWRDYIADTGHLTLEQHGAYLLLMAHYYMTGRPLPANASVLHRICRCTTDADRSATEQIIRDFFVLDGEVYRHHRIDQELVKAAGISQVRRAAANARHQKTHPNQDASVPANAVQMHTQPQSQSQPETQRQPEKSSSSEPSSSDPVGPNHSPKKKEPKPPSDKAVRLAQKLHDEICKNKPDFLCSESSLTSWAKTADLLMVRDGRSYERISALIGWVQGDQFWKCNVLSMDKLRKKFDELEMKARSQREGRANHGNGKPGIAEVIERETAILRARAQ